MAQRGGKREGAGRKKGEATIHAEAFRAKLTQLVAAEAEKIIRPQIEKAKKGDTQAFHILVDKFLPKLGQMEISGKDGAPIVFSPFELLAKRKLDDTSSGTE